MSGEIDILNSAIAYLKKKNPYSTNSEICEEIKGSKLSTKIVDMGRLCLSILTGEAHSAVSDYFFKAHDSKIIEIEGLVRFSNPVAQNFISKHRIKFEPECNILLDVQYKIPSISHAIWVTDPGNPRLINPHNIEILKSKIKQLNSEDGVEWKHILWVNHDWGLLRQQLDGENIEFRNINELNPSNEINRIIDLKLREGDYVTVSDVVRLQSVKELGGVYSDIDGTILYDTRCVRADYSFFGASDVSTWDFSLNNNFIASIEKSPIIIKSLEMIERNLGTNAPIYIEKAASYFSKVISSTGPTVLTIAFLKEAGEGDIAFSYNACGLGEGPFLSNDHCSGSWGNGPNKPAYDYDNV